MKYATFVVRISGRRTVDDKIPVPEEWSRASTGQPRGDSSRSATFLTSATVRVTGFTQGGSR
jgi:hypothetical protein